MIHSDIDVAGREPPREVPPFPRAILNLSTTRYLIFPREVLLAREMPLNLLYAIATKNEFLNVSVVRIPLYIIYMNY